MELRHRSLRAAQPHLCSSWTHGSATNIGFASKRLAVPLSWIGCLSSWLKQVRRLFSLPCVHEFSRRAWMPFCPTRSSNSPVKLHRLKPKREHCRDWRLASRRRHGDDVKGVSQRTIVRPPKSAVVITSFMPCPCEPLSRKR